MDAIFSWISKPILDNVFNVASVFFVGWIVVEAKKRIAEVVQVNVDKLRNDIQGMQDADLREIARHTVRYVAKKMPDASNDERLAYAIKRVQELTPNIVMSDDNVKVLIEYAYMQCKNELELL